MLEDDPHNHGGMGEEEMDIEPNRVVVGGNEGNREEFWAHEPSKEEIWSVRFHFYLSREIT